MDACGNPAITRTQIITVDDNTAPVLAAAPADVAVECIGEVPVMTNLTWTDNCDAGGSVAGVDGPLVGGACGGTITRTWNVMDACGNPAITRTQIITVDDNTAPVLAAAPADVAVECIGEVPVMTNLTWTDNCDAGGSVAGVDGPLVGGACGGTITRTWNVMDACGNPAITRTQIITVDDNTAPVLAAADVAVECIGEVPVMTNLTWSDNCDAGGSVAGVDGPLVGGACGGTITRTWNVMDACGNPAITRTQIITVDDNTAPVLAAAPADVAVECIGEVPVMTNLTWTDNCDAGGSVAGVDGPLVGGACGRTITRTWNVMDACGNPAITRTQIITVDDNTAPVLAAAPADVSVECIGEVPVMTNLTWTDNCDAGGSVAGVDGPLVGGACGGTITRTWNVMDACGNPAITRTQIITVDDNTAPVLAAAPADVAVECIGEVPVMTNLTWTDNCDAGGSVAGVNGPLVGGACGGTITRTWNVMDACGNPAITRTQIITVDDNTAPVLAAAPLAVLVSCIEDVPGMINLPWTDNCDAGGSVAGVDGVLVGGECGGTITRTWNVMDACGNPAITRTQIITIHDLIPPMVTTGIVASCYDSQSAAEAAALAATTATDNCTGILTKTFNTVVTSCEFEITVTVTDECGNASTAFYSPLNSCQTLHLKVFLEGPYNPAGDSLFSQLNKDHLLPGQNKLLSPDMSIQLFAPFTPFGQPYSGAPWYYTGNMGMLFGDASAPGAPMGVISYPLDVVDWVLVTVREGGKLPADSIWSCAGWVHTDGEVTFPEACSPLNIVNTEPYYVVVQHRNHLTIMSDDMDVDINCSGNRLEWDFTTSNSYQPTFRYGQKKVDTVPVDKWAMHAANGEQITSRLAISSPDRTTWRLLQGVLGYSVGDFNMNSVVTPPDETVWKNNQNKTTGVSFY
ncbi:MAG: hypothetical protein IPN60_15760 [Saprospiraceae bacterium]|nr:hypothetical protein [Candidatus Opimibacter skivensis]